MERNELENKKLCAKCGGRCCKASGCIYFVEDFESMKLNYLESVLDTGRVSIKAKLCFDALPNGTIVVTPLLYLKSRNINRDAVDLVSFETTCASLEDDGCYFSFEDRPSGGVRHIPRENFECFSDFSSKDEIDKYLPHQKVLQKIVKRRTGVNVFTKLKEDVENLFIAILNENFEGVAPEEQTMYNNVFFLLTKAFPEQYINATKKSKFAALVLQRDFGGFNL